MGRLLRLQQKRVLRHFLIMGIICQSRTYSGKIHTEACVLFIFLFFMSVSAQVQALLRTYATVRALYVFRASLCALRCVCCVVWQTTCHLDLSPCKLLYQEPTRFSWHAAKEPAAHKQADCCFLVPLLTREIKGSFISQEQRVGVGKMFLY